MQEPRPSFPLLVSCVPRPSDEVYHEIICSPAATVERKTAGLYPENEPVGKAMRQVAKTEDGGFGAVPTKSCSTSTSRRWRRAPTRSAKPCRRHNRGERRTPSQRSCRSWLCPTALCGWPDTPAGAALRATPSRQAEGDFLSRPPVPHPVRTATSVHDLSPAHHDEDGCHRFPAAGRSGETGRIWQQLFE